MNKLRTMVKTTRHALIKDTRGANLVEYILLIGVVALLCIVAFKSFSDKVSAKVESQGNAVDSLGGEEDSLQR